MPPLGEDEERSPTAETVSSGAANTYFSTPVSMSIFRQAEQ